MARSLAGKTFYTALNNGIHALASADVKQALDRRAEVAYALTRGMSHADEMETRRRVEEGMAHVCVPVFTFARTSRVEGERIFTGHRATFDLLCQYIYAEGGRIVGDKGFHVPFSNGPLNYDYHFVTTQKQFVETFGLSPEALADLMLMDLMLGRQDSSLIPRYVAAVAQR